MARADHRSAARHRGRMPEGILRSSSGVSLVEIMVALTVFTVGVTVAMKTLPQGNASTTKSRNMAVSTSLAEEKLEELLNMKYDDTHLADGMHMDSENLVDSHFTRSWSVAADSPVPGMKTLSVTVEYPPYGANDKVTLETAITIGR